jgi:hypothetical protein
MSETMEGLLFIAIYMSCLFIALVPYLCLFVLYFYGLILLIQIFPVVCVLSFMAGIILGCLY